MTASLPRPATRDALFLWVMNRFSEVFQDRAVLKGGMALRLVDSPRATTDIDYVFVPFRSKGDIREPIEGVLRELDGADITIRLHSKMLRAEVRIDDAAIQIEVSVADQCPSAAMATAGFARSLGQPSHVVRVMSWDTALAHKLAAWNERRLLRDLYDCYFISARLGERPNPEALEARLARVRSRIPELKSRRSMSKMDLAGALRTEILHIDDAAISEALAPLLPESELAGLRGRLRAAVVKLAEGLEAV